MTRLVDEIVMAITENPGLTDRDLTNTLRGSSAGQQPINQAARLLERKGVLVRMRRPDALIGNYPSQVGAGIAAPVSKPTGVIRKHDVDALSEDEIKEVVESWLKADGWETKVAWGKAQGIDIDARRGLERWIIEVKGPGSRQPMRVNYFISILGETLQRMSDPTARYSIAFPDLPQYRNLWSRLPDLAKSRTGISIIFVSKSCQLVRLAE